MSSALKRSKRDVNNSKKCNYTYVPNGSDACDRNLMY